MNEAQTRQDLIDPKLRDAGWYDTDGARIRPEFPITKGALIGGGQRSSTLSADYVLQYRNRNVGVIEAKKRDLPYTEGVAQAKDYAERMQIRFAYATNGLKIYRIDMKLGQEEEVDRFPTPEELYDATFAEANEWRDKLFSVPFEDKGGAWQPRYYQENAISRVLEAVANDEDRILAHPGHRDGKDGHQLSNRLETVPGEVVAATRRDAPSTHPVPRRSQRPGRPGIQFIWGL